MNNLSEDILMRYLTGECSDEDFARVNAWIKESDDNARRLFRMEEVYHLGRHDSFPDQKKVARAEARLYKKLAQEDAHSRKVIRMHQWMRYAAIIVLALMIGTGGGYLYYQADPTRNMITASSTDGKVKEVMLPDGTKVWLNQSATLRYPKEFSESERDVYLDGEAYFEVSKDAAHPFKVETGAIIVQVLGTHFNVEAYPEDTQVKTTLLEGSVSVSLIGKAEESLKLSPNESAIYNKDKKSLTLHTENNASEEIIWRNGTLLFKSIPLQEIVRQLSNAFHTDIRIEDADLQNYRMTATFSDGETLEEILSLLCRNQKFEYTKTNDIITITQKLN